MSKIESSASSPPFQCIDKDTSNPAKPMVQRETKANHLLVLPHFKMMIMAKLLEKIARKPQSNPHVQIKASHSLMKAIYENIPRKLRS